MNFMFKKSRSIINCTSMLSTFGMDSTSDSITTNIDLNNIKNNTIKDLKCLGIKRFENGDNLYKNLDELEKFKDNDLQKEPKSNEYNKQVNSINFVILNCTKAFLENENNIEFIYNNADLKEKNIDLKKENVDLKKEIENIKKLENFEEIDLLTLFLYESLYYYNFKFPSLSLHQSHANALSDEGYTTIEQREEILEYKKCKKPFCQFIYDKIKSSNILESQDSKNILENMFKIFCNYNIKFNVDKYKKELINGINKNLQKGIYLNRGAWGNIYYLDNYKNLLLKEYFKHQDDDKNWEEDYKLEQEIKRVFNFINVKINKNKLFDFANEEFHIYNELEIIEKVDLSVSTEKFRYIYNECELDNKLDVLQNLIFTNFLNSLNNYKNIIKTYPGDRNDQNILFKSCNNKIKMINIDYIDYYEKYPIRDSVKYIVDEKKILEFDIRNVYFDYYNVDLYLALLNRKKTLYDLCSELPKKDRNEFIEKFSKLIAKKNLIDQNRHLSLFSIIFDNENNFYISQNNLPFKNENSNIDENIILKELTRDNYIFERDIFDEGKILETGLNGFLSAYKLEFQDNNIVSFDIIKFDDYIYEVRFYNFDYNYSHLFNSAYDVIIREIYNKCGNVIICADYDYNKLPEKNNFLSHYAIFDNNGMKLSEINKRVNEFTNLDINADNILSLNIEMLDEVYANVFLPKFDYFKSKYSIDLELDYKTPKPKIQTIPFINNLCLKRLSKSNKPVLKYLFKSLNNIFFSKNSRYMKDLLKKDDLNSRIKYFNNIGLSYLLLWDIKKKYFKELYYRLLYIKHITFLIEKLEKYGEKKFFDQFINHYKLKHKNEKSLDEDDSEEDDDDNNSKKRNKRSKKRENNRKKRKNSSDDEYYIEYDEEDDEIRKKEEEAKKIKEEEYRKKILEEEAMKNKEEVSKSFKEMINKSKN